MCLGRILLNVPKKTEMLLQWQAEMRCALKAQLLVEFDSGQIIAIAVDKGKTHDFKLLKHSLPFVSSQLCLADRGYQRFAKYHE